MGILQINNRRLSSIILLRFAFVLICSFLLLPTIAEAFNRAFVDVGKTGQAEPLDTIYMGGEYEFRFLIENDMAWHGFTLVYEIWSDDGTQWEWLHQPDGWSPFGQGYYPAIFTVVPGSRMDPIEDTFDGLLLAHYRNIDGILADSIATGANRQFDPGLLPGEMQPMISIHFRAIGPWSPGEIKQMCIRHTNYPVVEFLFINSGAAFMPEVNTPICIPIKTVCGDANGDGAVNLADAGYIINYIFFEGSLAPAPIQLGDGNGDGSCNLGDASYTVNYIFYDGPAPVCP